MQLAISVGSVSAANLMSMTQYVQHAERLGVSVAWSHEAWGSDAATPLAYLAARTSRIKLGCGVMQISARVPAMTAMTALTLDVLCDGRFLLGLGASGPQVVEGLHGASYAGPLTRLKETVEIVRQICRGEKLVYSGKFHELPRPGGEGKPLRVDFAPRPELPVYLATLGPRALAYTGAAADGWLGTSFSPDHAEAHLEHLRDGAEQHGRTLADLDLHVACQVAIGENVERLIEQRKAATAFTLGAMGSAATNFYNDAFRRAGYADDALAVQRLWLDGQREAAARRVPDELVTKFGAIGDESMVRERLAAYRAAGVDCLHVRFDGAAEAQRYDLLEQVCDMV